MTDSFFPKFQRKFSNIATFDELKYIYDNCNSLRKNIILGDIKEIKPRHVLKSLKNLRKNNVLFNNNKYNEKVRHNMFNFMRNTNNSDSKSHGESDSLNESDESSETSSDKCDSDSRPLLRKRRNQITSPKNRRSIKRKCDESCGTKILKTQCNEFLNEKHNNSLSDIYDNLEEIRLSIRNMESKVNEHIFSSNKNISLQKYTMPVVPGNIEDAKEKLQKHFKLLSDFKLRILPMITSLQSLRSVTNGEESTFDDKLNIYREKAIRIIKETGRLIDYHLNNGHIAYGRIEILKQDNGLLCTELRYTTVLLGVEYTWTGSSELNKHNMLSGIVIDNEYELIKPQFTADATLSDPDTIQGNLKLFIDLNDVIVLLTELSWRPPITLFQNRAAGELGIFSPALLSNRYLIFLRFMLHSFVHIICSCHPAILNPSFDHPFHNPIFESLYNHYLPLHLLRD